MRAHAQLPGRFGVREAISASFLAAVAPETAGLLFDGAVVSRVRAREVFIIQAEEHRCAIVVDGLVRVFMVLANGHERAMREVTQGGAIGIAAFTGLTNTVNAQAVVDSHVLELDPELLTEAATSDPTLALALLREVSARLRDTELLMAVELLPIRQRLARRLLEQAVEMREEPAVAHISHTELSLQLGCSREWITRTLAAFRRGGLVEFEAGHRIRLLDPLGLHALAHGLRALGAGGASA